MSSHSFWHKVRTTMGRVPFLPDAVAGWFCLRDPTTPWRVRIGLGGALAYFVVPLDFIPDILAGLGYGDDLAVVMGVVRLVSGHITDDHRRQARQALTGMSQSADVVPGEGQT